MLIRSQNKENIFEATSAWVIGTGGTWELVVCENGENWIAGEYEEETAALKALNLIFRNSAKGKATDLSRDKR